MNQSDLITKQYTITTAAGKRLIAKSLLQIPAILDALENRTVVIVAGTTNGYVADEILGKLGQSEGFSRSRFFRGVTLPHNYKKVAEKTNKGNNASAASSTTALNSASASVTSGSAASGEDKFLGDVVIEKGSWVRGKTIFDVAEELKAGDIIFKGANAVNLELSQAAVLIGHPTAGTTNPILQCSAGRRVDLYIPVGLEKRITANISEIAAKLNSSNATGNRYLPISGKIVTELQAVKLLTGAGAELVAGGGICGAEGCYWLAVTGTIEQLAMMDEIYDKVQNEPNIIL